MKIRALVIPSVIALSALGWVASRTLGVAGIATLKEDVVSMADLVVSFAEAVWQYLSLPPVEFVIGVWTAITISYVLWLLGSDRLIRFSRIFFSRTRREAEYKLLADDTAVKALRAAACAKDALEAVNWDPIPALKISPYSDESQALASLEGDYWHQVFHLELPEGYVENVLALISNENGEIMKKYRQRIGDAALRAQDNKADWPRYEGDGIFPNEKIRAGWHARRCQIDEVNKIKKEIKAKLERVRKAWPGAIDEETRSRLLKDIGEEMLP